MKLATLTLALAATLTLTGSTDLMSLNPIVTGNQATADSNFAGTWKSDDGDLYVIQLDQPGYSILYTDSKGQSVKFSALLFRAGNAELLDLVNKQETFLQLPVHAAMRIWIAGNQLQFVFQDSKWLRQLAARQLPSQPYEDSLLLTSPGESLLPFFLKYGADAKAYESTPVILTRIQ